MRKNLILVGAGGHALSCIDLIESSGMYSIVGIVGEFHEIGQTKFGYKVLGSDDNLADLRDLATIACIGLGQIQSPEKRMRALSVLKALAFEVPTIVSPTAYISKRSQIGEAATIHHNVTINGSVVIGDNCIINSGSIIEHGSRIESNSHVSTGVVINGDVVVGNGSFIGSGTVVKQGVRIGSNSFINMGQFVHNNVSNSSIINEGR